MFLLVKCLERHLTYSLHFISALSSLLLILLLVEASSGGGAGEKMDAKLLVPTWMVSPFLSSYSNADPHPLGYLPQRYAGQTAS